MEKIVRTLENTLQTEWNQGKVIVLIGPRQVGKTTLLLSMCENEGNYLFLNGDDIEDKLLLKDAGETKLKNLIGKKGTIFIDEAQRIPDIGLLLKIIHDRIPSVRVLVSGSSALELSNSLNESLTGRKWEHHLFPISWQELVEFKGYKEARKNLNHHLIYGMYPEVIMHSDNAEKILKEITNSYLYKDLLQYQSIRKPEIIDKLLLALSLQIGSEVNYNELAKTLRIDRATVEQYISLLEKAFVVFRLQPLSRNVRNEISTNRKVYFYDLGIRNAIIGNFKSPEFRNDMGGIWENFLIAERLKIQSYTGWQGRSYYWRTYAQQEVDFVEESNGEFMAFEFKWNPLAKAKIPESFISNYKPSKSLIVHPENMDEYLIID